MKGALLLFSFLAFAFGSDMTVVFLLDMSGSMEGQEEQIVASTNMILDDMIKTNANHPNTKVGIYVYTFSTSHSLLMETTLANSPRLSVSQYKPNGGTSLFDTIGTILNNVQNGTTIVIATDGEDTTSTQVSKKEIIDQISNAKESRDIDFIFIAKGPEAFSGGEDLGVRVMSVDDFSMLNMMPVSAMVSVSAFRHETFQE